jgi:hypothetical protein
VILWLNPRLPIVKQNNFLPQPHTNNCTTNH